MPYKSILVVSDNEAIVGEFIGGGGLGAVIDAARTRQRVDIVDAARSGPQALGMPSRSRSSYDPLTRLDGIDAWL